MAQIFISYSRSDRSYVDRLAAYLEGGGLTVWYDYELSASDRWMAVIKEQIEACAALVLVMSPSAEASTWVEREFGHAERIGKPVVPVLYLGEPFWHLANVHAEDVRQGHLPTQRFLNRLREIVAATAPAVAPDASPSAGVPVRPRPEPVVPPVPRLEPLVPAVPVYTFRGGAGGFVASMESVAFSPDSGHLAAVGGDRQLRIWRIADGEPVHAVKASSGWLTGAVRAVVYSPDGTRIVTGGDDRTLRIWDARSAEPVWTITAHNAAVEALVFAPDGAHFASAGRDGTTMIWRADTGLLVRELSGKAVRLAHAPDSALLATGTADGTVRIWNTASGTAVRTIATGKPLYSMTYSPDGDRLATGSHGEVGIWRAESGAHLRAITGQHGQDLSLAYSPDGTRLASGNADGVRIWDADAGVLLDTVARGMGTVSTVAYSPDGTRLAAAGADGTARIWQVARPA